MKWNRGIETMVKCEVDSRLEEIEYHYSRALVLVEEYFVDNAIKEVINEAMRLQYDKDERLCHNGM